MVYGFPTYDPSRVLLSLCFFYLPFVHTSTSTRFVCGIHLRLPLHMFAVTQQWHTKMKVKLVSSSANSELSMPETPRRFTWRHFHSGGRGETQQRDNKGPNTKTPIQGFNKEFKSEKAVLLLSQLAISYEEFFSNDAFMMFWFTLQAAWLIWHLHAQKTAGRRTKVKTTNIPKELEQKLQRGAKLLANLACDKMRYLIHDFPTPTKPKLCQLGLDKAPGRGGRVSRVSDVGRGAGYENSAQKTRQGSGVESLNMAKQCKTKEQNKETGWWKPWEKNTIQDDPRWLRLFTVTIFPNHSTPWGVGFA